MISKTFSLYRNDSQKPDGELTIHFQQAFSGIISHRESPDPGALNRGSLHARAQDNIIPSMDMRIEPSYIETPFNGTEEHLPKIIFDLNLAPSWMELGFSSFMPSYSPPPGVCRPNLGGMGATFRNQAGILQTPTEIPITTPSFLLNTVPSPQHLNSHRSESLNPRFVANNMYEINSYIEQASYAPNASLQQDSGYNTTDHWAKTPSVDDLQAEMASKTAESPNLSANITGDLPYAKSGR